MKKYFWCLIVYLIILSTILATTFSYNYIFSDEGTHLLLSTFYHNLIGNLPSLDFSYDKIYNFSINYLVYYPKLQIAYPPVYHITNAFIFFITGPSIVVSRLVSLLYGIGTFLIFYFLIRRYFSDKIAFISVVFFSLSTYSLFYVSRGFQDFTSFFFMALSFWTFLFANKKQKMKYFILLSIPTALAILAKQTSIIIVVFFIVYILFRRRDQRVKQISIFVLPLLLILLPYFLILNTVGGFQINKLVAIDYASDQGEPTSILDIKFWLYFLIEPVKFAPFTILFVGALFFYIYKKEKYWKELLIYFLTFYLCLSLIPNKEVRFSQLYLLPAYVIMALYITKAKKQLLLPTFLVLYIITSTLIFYPTIQSYPQNIIVERVYNQTPKNASLAILSDSEPLYSSSIISYMAVRDAKIVILRPCAFGETKEDILNKMDAANVYFVLHTKFDKNQILEKVKDELELSFSISERNLTTDVYKYKNFKDKSPENICNYICLTGEKICKR